MINRLFIVGKGASLKGFDFALLKDEYTLCLNHSVFVIPNPSAVCFMDESFYKVNMDFFNTFKGDVFTITKTGHPAGKRNLKGLTILSGIYAIDEALNIADKIYLLGYDLNSKEREYPYFGDFNNLSQEQWEKDIPTWYHDPAFTRPRIEMIDNNFGSYKDRIFNCNFDSGVKTFKFKDIYEVLSEDSKTSKSKQKSDEYYEIK